MKPFFFQIYSIVDLFKDSKVSKIWYSQIQNVPLLKYPIIRVLFHSHKKNLNFFQRRSF